MNDLMKGLEKPVVVRFDDIEIPEGDVIKRMGYPSARYQMDEAIRRMLDEEMVRAEKIIDPRVIFRVLKVKELSDEFIRFCETDFMIQSVQVAKLLRMCNLVIVFMCTIGSEVEAQSEAHLKSDEMTSGWILDSIGSETADAVADRFHRAYVKESAESQGYKITARFSPGYGDWPLTNQKQIHALCEGRRIGIRLSETSLMHPRKSVSAIFGLASNG